MDLTVYRDAVVYFNKGRRGRPFSSWNPGGTGKKDGICRRNVPEKSKARGSVDVISIQML